MFRPFLQILCLASILAVAIVGCGGGEDGGSSEPPPDLQEMQKQYNEDAGRYGPGGSGPPGGTPGGPGGGPPRGHGR